MVNTIYLLSFVETPRKFIIAELSIRIGQISYVASISDLLDFRKYKCPPASVLQNFAVTEAS